MKRGLDDISTDDSAPGPSGGIPAAPSNGSNFTLRGKKTVGFIGLDETARAILKEFEPVADKLVNDERLWTTTVYLAREESAAPRRESMRGDAWPASIEPAPSAAQPSTGPPGRLDFLYEENLQVAIQSDIIIIDSPPDMVLPILRERGIALALAEKAVVSLATGVTINQMYNALYSRNTSPFPIDDSEVCFITRANPTFIAPVDGSGSTTSTLLVPPMGRVHRPSQPQVRLVEKFFSSFGTISQVDESDIGGNYYAPAA